MIPVCRYFYRQLKGSMTCMNIYKTNLLFDVTVDLSVPFDFKNMYSRNF